MEELASRLNVDTDKLLSRWDGRPDRVIEDVFRVRDLESKEVVDLELTPYQRQFVHAYWYGDESSINVLKGRRTGYSFIACATILLDAITTPHGFFAITGPSKSQAKDRIDDIYDLMEWSRLNFENLPVDNRDEIELPNHATMMAFAGNPDTSRGADSADTLYIDEMSFLEDQEESMNAFSPFTSLGDAQTVEISTPFTSNDLFMQDQDRGSPTGENGIISIEQPAFKNPDEIDVQVSLFEQDVEPVMPYLDLEEAEKDRARDPEGFRQEYLCKPVEDEYRFFDEDTVKLALQRGESDEYQYGKHVGAVNDGTVWMGLDIAGSGKDDIAVTLVEHDGSQRYLRYHETITDRTLEQANIEPANARNPSAIAERVNQLYHIGSVDYIITDSTSIGEGFDSEIRETIGRGIHSFNFSDQEDVAEMMGDLNHAFHNGNISLVPDETLRDQLLAIVKEKNKKSSNPSFSGKEHAPNGKDDVAFALALAAFPPTSNSDVKSPKEPSDADFPNPEDSISLSADSDDSEDSNSERYRGATHRKNNSRSRNGSNSYSRRYARK